MNQYPLHFDKFALLHDPMNHITMLLFALIIGLSGVEGVNQSMYPILMPDLDFLSNLDPLARKMEKTNQRVNDIHL